MADNSKTEGSLLTYKKLTPEEERRLEAFYREKAERDRITMLADATNKGRAEGIAEGKAEVAANLRAMGMSEEQIKLALNGLISEAMEDNSADEDDEDDWDDGR